MPTFPISPYDRPSIALSRLLAGDVRGAGTAMVSPEKLPPSRLTSMKDYLMGNWRDMAKKNPVLSALVSTFSDPLIIGMLLLQTRWPVMGAQQMFKYGKKYAGYFSRLGPIEGLLARGERIFAGTNIPKLFVWQARQQERIQQKWGKTVGDAYDDFKAAVGRYPSSEEHLILGAKSHGWDAPFAFGEVESPLLAGKIKLSPELDKIYQRIVAGKDAFMKEMYQTVIDPLKKSKAGQAALARWLEKTGIAVEDLGKAGGPAGRMYFPRTLRYTDQMVREYADWKLHGMGGDLAGMERAAIHSMQSKVSGHQFPRLGITIPAREQMDAVSKATGIPVNEKAWGGMMKHVERWAKDLTDQAAEKMGMFEQRMMKSAAYTAENAMMDLGHFLHSRGIPTRTREAGSVFQQAANLLREGRRGEWHELMNRYISSTSKAREYEGTFGLAVSNYMHSLVKPHVWTNLKVGSGEGAMLFDEGRPLSKQLSLGEALMSETNQLTSEHQMWMKSDYIPILQGQMSDPQLRGMLRWTNVKLGALGALEGDNFVTKTLPKKYVERIKSILMGDKGSLGYVNTQGKIAGHFYLSTLGLNPASAFQNLLQPLITIIPQLGVGPFFQGLASTTKKLMKYVELRFGSPGLDKVEALKQAFPEFAQTTLAPAPLSETILRGAMDEMITSVSGMEVPGLRHGSRPWIEQAKRAAMAMFSKSEMWNRLLSFESGLAKAKTDGLLGVEAVDFADKVVRSTQFPAGVGQMPRALMKLSPVWRQFMYFPIRYANFLTESTMYGGADKRNWGTIARTIAASAIVNKVATEGVGIDISRSLMLGALPLPQYKDSPFYPLPVVPPALSVIGGLGAAMVTGDTDTISRQLSLLAPGGVAGMRAWKSLAPRYARYDQRTPDGRIPVYNKKGALIGNHTPRQLALRALGIQPMEVRAEQEFSRYLMNQRDAIRDMRREYVDAMMRGRSDEAQGINDAYRKMFPELGPIQIKKSDIKAAQDRRMFNRMQRLLRTMPKEYRQSFANMLSATMSSHFMESFPLQEPAPLMPQARAGYGGGFAMPSYQGRQAGLGGAGSAFPVSAGAPTPSYGPASVGFGA